MPKDRNQHAREQFAAGQARRAFLAALSAGETGVYDKERTRLEPGHLIVWKEPSDLLPYWAVTDVAPALDIDRPAIRVTLTTTAKLVLPAGQQLGNLLIIGKQAAADGAGAPPEDGDAPSASPRDLAHDTLAAEEEESPRDTQPTQPEPPPDRAAPHPPGDGHEPHD